MKYYLNHVVFMVLVLLCSSCNRLLDEKTDIKMVIPKTLNDAELLLNDYSTMNTGFPAIGEIAADQYYISEDIFEGALNTDQQNFYTWADRPYNDANIWQRPYKTVYMANQVLEILNKLPTGSDLDRRNRLTGAAHFYRAFAFQQLVEVFCPAYDISTATNELGVPIRLEPAMDQVSSRGTLKQSVDQVIKDYEVAIGLLPLEDKIIGRPIRAAAYASLARVYLTMSDFDKAYAYADSCLQLRSDLLDYNELDSGEDLPIPKYNAEILFLAMSGAAGPMNYSNNTVEPGLYNSYEAADLRKKIFFQQRDDIADAYRYRGNYDQNKAVLFIGLTTSELFLIKAEAAVRLGKFEVGRTALNTLLRSRYRTGSYTEITESDGEMLLSLIIREREKELVFRGRRWSDLKRLNQESRFKKTLTRTVKGQVFTLEPGSLQYAFRLPEPVVTLGNIPQNNR
jgi:tetratricopeptide (TPR) repeat protein